MASHPLNDEVEQHLLQLDVNRRPERRAQDPVRGVFDRELFAFGQYAVKTAEATLLNIGIEILALSIWRLTLFVNHRPHSG
jgi:hypothetical protein